MESVFTEKSLAPIGPYSQAIKAAGQVFLSQVGPWDPSAKKVVTGSVADQTRQMCRNAGAVLEAAGSGLEKVVKVVVYFTDLDDFGELNGVYAGFFPQKPARSSLECRRLPGGFGMAMDLIAVA